MYSLEKDVSGSTGTAVFKFMRVRDVEKERQRVVDLISVINIL